MSRESFLDELKVEPTSQNSDLHINTITLNEEELTTENLEKIINDLFYKVRDLSSKKCFSEELRDKFSDYLDSSPDGVTGVQILMSNLKGGWYKFDKEAGEYIKQPPMSAQEIYPEVNNLITRLNELIDSELPQKDESSIEKSNDDTERT